MQMTENPRVAHCRYFIGGSDARVIIGDDEAARLRLWRKKRGEVEPEDLSTNLIVQLGLATDPVEDAVRRIMPLSASTYLGNLPGGGLRSDFRRRTPGPPPFSSMNSTPADSSARRSASSLAAVIEVSRSASSARLTVFTPKDASLARSIALHFKSARAALI